MNFALSAPRPSSPLQELAAVLGDPEVQKAIKEARANPKAPESEKLLKTVRLAEAVLRAEREGARAEEGGGHEHRE